MIGLPISTNNDNTMAGPTCAPKKLGSSCAPRSIKKKSNKKSRKLTNREAMFLGNEFEPRVHRVT